MFSIEVFGAVVVVLLVLAGAVGILILFGETYPLFPVCEDL